MQTKIRRGEKKPEMKHANLFELKKKKMSESKHLQ